MLPPPPSALWFTGISWTSRKRPLDLIPVANLEGGADEKIPRRQTLRTEIVPYNQDLETTLLDTRFLKANRDHTAQRALLHFDEPAGGSHAAYPIDRRTTVRPLPRPCRPPDYRLRVLKPRQIRRF